MAKQTAMLEAAEALFMDQGYDLVSIDAIALRAAVSSRTVYDHFGSKEGLFRAVLERVTTLLLQTLHTALDETLPPGFAPATGLLAFARRVATGTFPSSDFVRFRRLLAASGTAAQNTTVATPEPEALLEARMQEAIDRGELTAASAQRATSHFVALTFLLALELIDRDREVSAGDIDELITDGVAVFLRAYQANTKASPGRRVNPPAR